LFNFRSAYENNVIPSSATKPYIVLFYGDLCFPCFHIEPVWQKIVHELEPLGVGFAAIHSQHESSLARKIGVHSLPYVVSVVDGHVKHYKDEQLSLSKAIEFVRQSLPSGLITKVDDKNYETFLTGWTDNRVHTLFINKDRSIRLRYLLIAFQYRERIAFGHVDHNLDNSVKIMHQYRVDTNTDSMLVFHEDISRPIAALSLAELKPQIMKDVLETNKFLLLPRLSSQVYIFIGWYMFS
jgi:DnaJ homolog subfamily C member 16